MTVAGNKGAGLNIPGQGGASPLPPIPTPPYGRERWFIYEPTGVAAGNVYTSWSLMMAAIGALPIGESPTVCIVDTTGSPVVVPAAGMPVNGWNMRGGSIVAFYRATGSIVLDVPAGVMFDMLFEIGNGLVLSIAPPAGTGVLNYSLLPDGGAFIFTIGLGAFVTNAGAGALTRTRGAATTGTYVLVLFGAQQNAPFGPPSPGPMLELTGDDSAVLSQAFSFQGMPVSPAPSWIVGGGAASQLIVVTDVSGTLPDEWSAGFTGGGPVLVFYTDRNALRGTTAQRPAFPAPLVGLQFFDTTIGLPVWFNGAIWVDAAGAAA